VYVLIVVQPDYDRIIKNIERGEARISRKDEIMKAIGKKLDRYKNPWLELKIQYGQNKGKFYNEECDRFMVCSPTILCGFMYLSTLYGY
jgi:SWI/SNF-related matrix-associated actin-dependent regulator of chromatin subfamily A member 5